MEEEPNFWTSRPAHWALLAAILLAFFLPTLSWRDFTDGMENFNVLTAMECARDGHWLIPTSNGLPRLQKPPLTSWITAGGLLLGGQMEFAARWPNLIISWILLIAVYETGRIVRDARFALEAAVICATTIYFLRYSRRASYDLQLAAWVAVCNWFVVSVIVRRNWFPGCICAGVGLGLAMMTKGPVALTWTVAPLVAWAILERIIARGGSLKSRQTAAIVVGALVMLAISLPWVVYVYLKAGSQLALWMNEARLEDEGMERSRAYFGEGLVCLVQLLPWTPLMIVGMFGLRRGIGGVSAGIVRLMIWTIVLPLIVVSFVPPVRDRYLLPMVAPAAILAAAGLAAMRGVKWMKFAPWALAAGMLVFNLGWSWHQQSTPESESTLKRGAEQIVSRWPGAQVFSLADAVPPRELSIYLNRPIVPIEKFEQVPISSGPQLLVLRSRKTPASTPPGWSFYSQINYEWLVYQRGAD